MRRKYVAYTGKFRRQLLPQMWILWQLTSLYTPTMKLKLLFIVLLFINPAANLFAQVIILTKSGQVMGNYIKVAQKIDSEFICSPLLQVFPKPADAVAVSYDRQQKLGLTAGGHSPDHIVNRKKLG